VTDRKTVITDLQIIHTWAEFALERDLQFFTKKHLEDIAQWTDNALELLKEQEAVVAHWDDDTGHWIEGDRDGIDRHTRTTGEMIDTFRCSWCGFYQYWKTPFCPNCGAKMDRR